jgi:hypothetical protein
MDELDILKKDWNKDDGRHKPLSTKDIYPLLHKKSSSIVKMLFYISLAELVFWILVNILPFFFSDNYQKQLDLIYPNKSVFIVINIFTYVIILLFIYLLFKSHKSISVTDNAKKLMESILKTRKIIKYYVIYNLIMAFISMVFGLYVGITHNPEISNKLAEANDNQTFIIMAIFVIATAAFVFIIWLFYRLIYGLLLKRLNKNYKELKKLEV